MRRTAVQIRLYKYKLGITGEARMDNATLDGLLDRIAEGVPDFDTSRVRTPYLDIANVYSIASEHEEARDQSADLFALAEQRNDEAVVAAVNTDWRLATLLKSLYLFSDIYINVFLAEVAAVATMSINTLIKNPPDVLKPADPAVILPAYCVSLYRNKLVAHHDVSRIGAFGGPSSDAGWHLSPIPKNFNWPQEVLEETGELAKKYCSEIPELASETNCFNRISLLFHSVPIGTLGSPSEDRLAVNRLAEKGGCRSASRTDVLAAVDSFTHHIADVVSV